MYLVVFFSKSFFGRYEGSGSKGGLPLLPCGLRQQSGQLPQLRRRHHAHPVKHGVHQHVSLVEQHAVIQERRLPADLLLLPSRPSGRT